MNQKHGEDNGVPNRIYEVCGGHVAFTLQVSNSLLLLYFCLNTVVMEEMTKTCRVDPNLTGRLYKSFRSVDLITFFLYPITPKLLQHNMCMPI